MCCWLIVTNRVGAVAHGGRTPRAAGLTNDRRGDAGAQAVEIGALVGGRRPLRAIGPPEFYDAAT